MNVEREAPCSSLPDLEFIRSLIDPKRLLVIPKEPCREARKKIVAEARKLDLDRDSVETLPPYEPRQRGHGHSFRVQQDVCVRFDDCDYEPDGSLVLRQKLRLPPGMREPLQRPRPTLTQSDRQVWLYGKKAAKKAEALVEALHKAGVPVATSSAFSLPREVSPSQRHAIDPWNASVRFGPHTDAEQWQKRLEDLLQIEPGPGPWYDARIVKPSAPYALARQFYERVRGEGELSYRSLPLVLPQAAGPSGGDTGLQTAVWGQMNAQDMWNSIAAWRTLPGKTYSRVIVFVIDGGVLPSLPDAPVNTAASVLVDLSVAGWVMGATPFPGNTHGTRLTSIVGAAWDTIHMSGLTGIATEGDGPRVTFVSLRCGSLYDMRRALEYASTHLGGAAGVVLFGLDVLMEYCNNFWCPQLLNGEAARFADTLTRVTTAQANNLLVVVPAGNYDPTNTRDTAFIPLPSPPDMSGTIVVGASDAAGARWVDPGGHAASRFGVPPLTMLAPGAAVYSTTGAGAYSTASGTCFAAAHVAGVAALMRSIDPNRPPSSLKHCFELNCETAASPANESGYGLLEGCDAAEDVM